jgi:NAD(P)-dependent dehydrogenase (short-subunit alcohol dehydrogenase family)
MTENEKLQGKVAVITGGTTGIGLAAAKLFVREGAYVFIMGRRQRELDAAVKAIGSNVTGVQGDVARLADLDRLYEAVTTKRRDEGRPPLFRANLDLRSQGPPYSLQRY